MYSQPGRPREFKYKMREELINHIAQGATVEEAARIVGVSLRTVQRAAKHNDSFHHDLQLALHTAPRDPHDLMQRAARTHWRAAAWLLERTDPDRFAKRPPNSCSPGTLMDISDWLIERALEATPPENRETMYRHLRAAADKALDVLMPDKHIARRGMTGALAKLPTPLSSQERRKTIHVVPDYDPSKPSLLESWSGPPRVPRWSPPSGYKLQDSDAMDAEWCYPPPEVEEKEEAGADAVEESAELLAAREALRAAKTAAAARRNSQNGQSQSDKSRRDEFQRNNFTEAARASSSSPPVEKPIEKPVETTVEKPVEPGAAGAAPPAPPDGGIMSPKMSAATKLDATKPNAGQFVGTTASPAREGDPAPPEQHPFTTLLAQLRAKRQKAPSQRAA